MQEQIFKLTLEMINDEIYFNHLVMNLPNHSYYWSDDWSEEFYISAAKRGFISVSHLDGTSFLLLPELQFEYGILEFEKLHISKKVKALINKNRYSFCINTRFDEVLQNISNHHKNSWLQDNYVTLLKNLDRNKTSRNDFIIYSVELVERSTQKLIAGEIGYVIGRTYTSLSGFSSREKQHNNTGTLQMVLLAKYLHEKGFSFWNMGHPNMEYKKKLGSAIYTREKFLAKWNSATKNKTILLGT